MKMKIVQIMSLALIIVGIYTILDVGVPSDIWDIFFDLAAVVMILGGIFILLKNSTDVFYVAGVFTSIMGLSMSLSNLFLLTSENIFVFTFGIVITVSGILMILFSFSLYCGDRFNIRRITALMLIYCGISLIFLLYQVAFEHVNFGEALYNYRYVIIYLVLFILFLILVRDRSIRYDDTDTKIDSNLDSISGIFFNDDNAHVLRSVMIKAIDDDKWEAISEGPIIAETTVPLVVSGKRALMIIHKWNDGRYTAEIVRSNNGTIIQSLRFQIMDIVLDNEDVNLCKTITYYGTDGFFIRLLVNDEESKVEKMSKSSRIIYKLIGY